MKKVCLTLLSLFTVLFFISCGSKPAEEEQKPEAPVVEEPVVTETDDSAAKAELMEQLLAKINDARDTAIEAGAQDNAPDQMAKLDKLLADFQNSDNPEKDAQSIIDRYNLLANYSSRLALFPAHRNMYRPSLNIRKHRTYMKYTSCFYKSIFTNYNKQLSFET